MVTMCLYRPYILYAYNRNEFCMCNLNELTGTAVSCVRSEYRKSCCCMSNKLMLWLKAMQNTMWFFIHYAVVLTTVEIVCAKSNLRKLCENAIYKNRILIFHKHLTNRIWSITITITITVIITTKKRSVTVIATIKLVRSITSMYDAKLYHEFNIETRVVNLKRICKNQWHSSSIDQSHHFDSIWLVLGLNFLVFAKSFHSWCNLISDQIGVYNQF